MPTSQVSGCLARSGIPVQGLGFRVQGFRGLGFRVQGLGVEGFRVQGFRGLGLGVGE